MLTKWLNFVKKLKTDPPLDELSINVQKTQESWKGFRQDVKRISWNEYFILQAYLISTRSLDAQTQCGCVIVEPNHTIIATGYNSFIGGIDDSVLPNLRPYKYPFMIHAEHNAILSCAQNGNSCFGCTAYITGKPCVSCLQYMHQSGISKIYYYKNHNIAMVADENEQARFEIIKKLSGIELIELEFSRGFSEKIQRIKSCR